MQNSRKVLSIHQPNFLPWIGYFDKIKKSDVFVILDEVQIPRGKSVANRNKIKTPQGEMELVVPISKPKGNEGKITYLMARIADDKWTKKALKAIEHNYSKSPFFDKYFSIIKELFSQGDFCQMNVDFIKYVVKELEINTEIELLSQQKGEFGNKNELIVNLCRHFDANVYLSGKGAKKYNDTSYLNRFDIQLEYQEFEHPVYDQLHGKFIPYLSVLDLLMNHGPQSKNYI
ncbi:MAG: WbqC family protein [Bacteroidales bacterium]|nr:WbqC family protein [Bacteroidales bacterium]MCF8337147.1 WbqC family protein [Bacteroidales bacterium]